MKHVKFAVVFIGLVAFNSLAQNVSVTASTLAEAEAKVAYQAKKKGADYRIISAFTGNRVHMTATLNK